MTRARQAGVVDPPEALRQQIPLDQLYDILAFRVLVDTIPDCYSVLGIVHQAWRPLPGRIKDYIAMPKPNFYQSLHTTLVPEKSPAVRDPDPDAARWTSSPRTASRRTGSTRKGSSTPGRTRPRSAMVRQLLETTKEISDPREFLSALRIDLYPDEVYTFSPKGAVFSFPRGATPVDFAYRIHTDIGHRCVGARVNGRLVPLKTPLGKRRHRRDPHVAHGPALPRLARLRGDDTREEQDPRLHPRRPRRRSRSRSGAGSSRGS